nr:NADH dehydrogenase subunit 4L [Asiopsocus sonorensis]
MFMGVSMLYIYMYLMGIYGFFMKSINLLNLLINMEFLSLVLFGFFYILDWESIEKFLLIYFLVMCVCEGCLGLSVLVSMIRSFGNTYMFNLSLFKC